MHLKRTVTSINMQIHQCIKISLRIWLSFYYLIDMKEPLWRRLNMFVYYERDHWQPGMTALLKRKTPLSIILSLYQSICVRYNIKKAKTESHKKHGSSLRCRVCPKPAPPAYYCCSTCSNANGCKPFAVCGAKSRQNCGIVHAVTVHNIF